MKLSLRIARRYLFSRKSTNAINLISYISMAGMGLGAMVLIIILSVFNGFERIVLGLYEDFYADIEVRPATGKVFSPSDTLLSELARHPDVEIWSRTLQENAHLSYDGRDVIATLKGVDARYADVTDVDEHIVDGVFDLFHDGPDRIVLGLGVHYQLGTSVERAVDPVQVSTPKKGVQAAWTPMQTLDRQPMVVDGVFAVQQQFDERYGLVSIEAMQRQLDLGSDVVSALEVRLRPGADLHDTARDLQASLGPGVRIITRFEQDAELYRVMRTERWAIFAILSFILAIISFNIVASLSMLAIEKTRDISILKAQGMTEGGIRRIFLLEGVLGSLLGAVIGLALGILICWIQMRFGIIRLDPTATFIIREYPVHLRWTDVLLVLGVIVVLSVSAAIIPAMRAGRQPLVFSR